MNASLMELKKQHRFKVKCKSTNTRRAGFPQTRAERNSMQHNTAIALLNTKNNMEYLRIHHYHDRTIIATLYSIQHPYVVYSIQSILHH